MPSRRRRKKPPDPRLSPFDLLLDSSLPVDLATYWLYFWLRLQTCRFPCSIFDHGLSAGPMSSPVPFLSQMELGVCDGLVRYCRRVSFAPTMVPNVPNRGSGSANFERRWQDWLSRKLRFDPFSLLCFWQTQVSSHPPPLFITVFLGNFRVSCLIVVSCSLYDWFVYWIGLPRFSWSWIGLRFFLKNLALPIDFRLVILGHMFPWFTEFCECNSSPLCWLRSYVVKFPVSGPQVSLCLERLRARIRCVFAHLGFVGATLAPSNVMLNVSPEWNIPPVSPHLRLVVFDSVLQVRFLPLFLSPPRVNCHYGAYLLDNRLKHTLTHTVLWFNSECITYNLLDVNQLRLLFGPQLLVFGSVCDVQPSVITMVSLLSFTHFVSWDHTMLLWVLVLPLCWLCSYVVKPPESVLQIWQGTEYVDLGLILNVCNSTPFVQWALRLSYVLPKVLHDSKCNRCNSCISVNGYSSEGDCFLLILTLFASCLTICVKLRLFWANPSLWLFRVMGSHYAQMLGHHCSSICWYLASLLNAWNEVKGQFPLVYEDAFSETSSFDLTIHPVIKIKLDLYYVAGIRSSYCSHARWADSSVEAHGRILQPCSRFMGKNPFLWIFLLRLSCFHMPVLVHNHCTTDATVLYPFGGISCIVDSCKRFFVRNFEQHHCVLGPCRRALDMHLRMLGQVFTRSDYCYYFDVLGWNEMFPLIIQVVHWFSEIFGYLLYSCSLCLEWFVAQHDCVLGPCHTALEQHLPMLGLARRGARSIYLPRIFVVVSPYGTTGPCSIALDKHRTMLATIHNGFGQCSSCVFMRHYFLSGSSYGFSSSETDYLALRQGYVIPSASLFPYLHK